MKSYLAAILMAIGLAAPAKAEKLYSVWKFEPTNEAGQISYAKDKPFLTQRLIPYEAVQLDVPAHFKKKQINAGVILFRVYQADGRSAFCTLKDQSTGHTSKSLFIPAFDKRPCFVDEDGDGTFDKYFTVFDKYGSVLTPSGNLSKAKDLETPAPYRMVDPTEFPVFRGFSFYLADADDPSKRSIELEFDNGGGYSRWRNESPDTTPEMPTALNVRVSNILVSGTTGTMDVEVDSSVFIVGTSVGAFYIGGLPNFVRTPG